MGVLMSLLKQAKTLTKRQITLTTALLQHAPNCAYNALFLNNFLMVAISGPQSRPQLERATGSSVILICNQGVVGSNPTAGTKKNSYLA